MADSKLSEIMPSYHSRWYRYYLDPPSFLRRYRLNDPYWTRYHSEYERMRTSMLVQQDLMDNLMKQMRERRASRAEESSRISECVSKCATITNNLREDSRSISTIESEMEKWQRAVNDMRCTMSSLKSRTETMGTKLETLKGDFALTSYWLREFNIEALIAQMESRRRLAEAECQRIYKALNTESSMFSIDQLLREMEATRRSAEEECRKMDDFLASTRY